MDNTSPWEADLTYEITDATQRQAVFDAMGKPFRGAKIALSSDVTAVDASSTHTINWTVARFDTDTFWAASPNPSRITIPSGKGIRYVEVNFCLYLDLIGAGQSILVINHYNSGGTKLDAVETYSDSSGTDTYGHVGGLFSVSDGDYFEAVIYNADTSSTIKNTFDKTHFSIDVRGIIPV